MRDNSDRESSELDAATEVADDEDGASSPGPIVDVPEDGPPAAESAVPQSGKLSRAGAIGIFIALLLAVGVVVELNLVWPSTSPRLPAPCRLLSLDDAFLVTHMRAISFSPDNSDPRRPSCVYKLAYGGVATLSLMTPRDFRWDAALWPDLWGRRLGGPYKLTGQLSVTPQQGVSELMMRALHKGIIFEAVVDYGPLFNESQSNLREQELTSELLMLTVVLNRFDGRAPNSPRYP